MQVVIVDKGGMAGHNVVSWFRFQNSPINVVSVRTLPQLLKLLEVQHELLVVVSVQLIDGYRWNSELGQLVKKYDPHAVFVVYNSIQEGNSDFIDHRIGSYRPPEDSSKGMGVGQMIGKYLLQHVFTGVWGVEKQLELF